MSTESELTMQEESSGTGMNSKSKKSNQNLSSILPHSPRLTGNNYLECAQSVRLVIDGKRRLGLLTGETKNPGVTNVKDKSWKSENSMVNAWLVNSMDTEIARSYTFLATAKDVWDAVREMYSDIDNASQIYDLKIKLLNLVTWRSKKQGVVAQSSVEAELRALAHGICEILWIKKIMRDLNIYVDMPMKLYCDNKAAIDMANDPVHHDRTKHVDIDRLFIKEKLESGELCIPFVPSSQQMADGLTMTLGNKLFEVFIIKLGIIDISTPT